jgi:hypothetical protein
MMTIDDGPLPRWDVRVVPGHSAGVYADQAAALMALPMLVDVDRVSAPTVPVGELLADRLTVCGVVTLTSFVAERWPELATASELVVVEVLEVVNDWADHLMVQAMRAARLAGGATDDVAA